MYEQIPEELKRLRQWVCWTWTTNAAGDKRKLPVNPMTGGNAQSNNPETWGAFAQATAASARHDGIGFMFAGGYFGVDLDHVEGDIAKYRAGENNNIVTEFLSELHSYAELSVSGTGVHVICKGRLPPSGRRRGDVEMYESGRFFVMTGNRLGPYENVAECTDGIARLHAKYIRPPKLPSEAAREEPLADDKRLIEIASNAKNGQDFARLYAKGDITGYASQSEADLRLCSMLAFYTGRDPARMDALFRASALMRPKWDRAQAGTTYGAITIDKAVRECDSVYSPKTGGYGGVTIGAGPSAPDEPARRLYSFDDTGNAERLRDMFPLHIAYNYADKAWMIYDGRRWADDNLGEIRRMADLSVERLEEDWPEYAKHLPEGAMPEKYEAAFRKFLKTSRSFAGKTAMIRETEHHVAVLPSQFDTHKGVINTESGLVDLRDGSEAPHDPKQYITRVTGVEYSKTAQCTRWMEFLSEIFQGDEELIQYIQKAVGYSLSGSTAEQCAFFLLGNGKNGKSTFLEVLSCVLGDYAMHIQADTIMLRNGARGGANSDIARLKGARFVTAAEPNEGVRLDEGLLKQLTGGDRVTARKQYGSEFEFEPEFKLWMSTNHKPTIRGTDEGIWRRIHLIPFNASFEGAKNDTSLKSKLIAEGPGILRWAVEGYILWRRDGLTLPKCMQDAVKAYRSEMDVVQAFLDDCCQTDCGQADAGELYRAYCAWAEDGNEYKMPQRKFGLEMGKRFQKIHLRRGWIYQGVSMNKTGVSVGVFHNRA
jgi:putative DNA primase/helicase